MAISTLLRSHRANRKAESTQQLLTFQLEQEWFALSIRAVQRVVPLGKVYGDPHRKGVSLTLYQDQELLVIDAGQRIFGVPSRALVEAETLSYLVIVQNSQGAIAGLPIVGQPALRRVPFSAFGPLPDAYVATGNIHCVSSRMIQTGEEPLLFLLDPERLVPA